MKVSLVSLLASFAIAAKHHSSGCGKSTQHYANESFWKSMEFNGKSYDHYITMPSDFDNSKPMPFFLFFHGYTNEPTDCGDLCLDANN